MYGCKFIDGYIYRLAVAEYMCPTLCHDNSPLVLVRTTDIAAAATTGSSATVTTTATATATVGSSTTVTATATAGSSPTVPATATATVGSSTTVPATLLLLRVAVLRVCSTVLPLTASFLLLPFHRATSTFWYNLQT